MGIEVSVCIITYMHENYIRQALDSVFMQKTNFDFEVIVGEDASPDNTREILLEYKEKYGDKLVLVLHDENVGVSRNSFSVQQKVRGKYIASLEGDDYWTDENKLQKQYDILENNPQYSAVCHDIMGIYSDGEVYRDSILRLKKDCVKTMKTWVTEGYSAHTCSIFRRNVFPINDEKYIKLRTAEPTMGDTIIFSLLYSIGGIYVFKDVMAAHRAAGVKDVASYSHSQKSKAVEYTYMYIRIINNIENYLDNEYNLKPLIPIRIAGIKISKLFKNINYDSKEMKQLMKTLPMGMRLAVYRKCVRKLWSIFCRKMRTFYEK